MKKWRILILEGLLLNNSVSRSTGGILPIDTRAKITNSTLRWIKLKQTRPLHAVVAVTLTCRRYPYHQNRQAVHTNVSTADLTITTAARF